MLLVAVGDFIWAFTFTVVDEVVGWWLVMRV